MNHLLEALLVLLALLHSIHPLPHLPSDTTSALIGKVIGKFATTHRVPCFVAGYQVFRINGTGESKAIFTNNGLADIENAVRCKAETILRVASVSKAIGSGLVASLIEAGKLTWDDDINKYIPISVFPKKTFEGENVTITLRQLISHTSGIRTTSEADLLHDWEDRITNSTQTVAFFAHDPLLFKPGTKFYYSNSGWNLIGAIVEAVENRSYHLVLEEYMEKRGMVSSRMDTRQQLIKHRASNYQVIQNGTEFYYLPAPITDSLRPVPHWPCGGVLSTASDLLSYGSALLDVYHSRPGAFLKAETLKSMWNYQPPVQEPSLYNITVDGHLISGTTGRYTLGWDRTDLPADSKDASLSNLTLIYHTGALGGTNSLVMIIPEADVVISGIANIGGIGEYLPSLGVQIYHILANGK